MVVAFFYCSQLEKPVAVCGRVFVAKEVSKNMSKTHNPRSFVYVTTGGDVELAEGAGKFKRFWKMIAKYGDYVDPRGGDEPMRINKEKAEKFVENFKSGVRGYIPTPLGHPKTDAELAEKNKGELMDVDAREDGLYGLLEIRDNSTAEAIEDKRIPDVSIAFDDDYQDKRTGKWVGATLRHVGLVVNPYLKGMAQFEPALSDASGAAVLFSDSVEANGDINNEKEEVTMGTVKNERDFPVEVTYTENDEEKKVTVEAGAEVEVPEDQVEAVTKQIADAVKPDEGGEEDEELSDEQKKEKALADREAAIAAKERALSEKEAEAKFATLLSEGKVVPAQKELYIALSSQSDTTVELSDGVEKSVSVLLSEFLEKIPQGFKLTEEGGKSGGDDDNKEEVEVTAGEAELAETFGNTKEQLQAVKKES